MTPTESRETMLTLLASTVDASGLSADGWLYTIDVHEEFRADPCALADGGTGVSYSSGIGWEGDTSDAVEMDAVVRRVRDHWEDRGMVTSLDTRDGNPGDQPHVWLIGEGGDEVRGVDITVIPGKITISAESVCVVGDAARLNLDG